MHERRRTVVYKGYGGNDRQTIDIGKNEGAFINRDFQHSIMVDLRGGEKELLVLDPVKVAIYKWIFGSYYWYKKVKVTNQRIIVSFQWFGYESFKGGLSFYYKKREYEKHKTYRDSLITGCEIGDGAMFGAYVKLTTKKLYTMKLKIYSVKNKEILDIIKTHSDASLEFANH